MTFVPRYTRDVAGLVMLLGIVAIRPLPADEPYRPPVAELVPLPEHQVAFRVSGVEKTRWHFGKQYLRPFFYPFNGPSGESLTRLGHPGAPNHDHHRSIWLAHHDVAGVDFWGDRTDATVQQKRWYAYEDGDDEAVMAVELGWYNGAGKELMSQDLIAALRRLPDGEHELEIQMITRPADGADELQLGKTNFGFLAVRVAKSISVHFGGGKITNSEGQIGEAAIFGKPARWIDYSGPVAVGQGQQRKTVTEGIAYFDHPDNPRYPAHWHVREDGWMGASFCMNDSYVINRDAPLQLRYLLCAHADAHDQKRTEATHKRFSKRPAFSIVKSNNPHRQYEVVRRRASETND